MFLSSIWADSFGGWASAMGQMALALCYFVSYVVLLESREQMRRLMVWYVYGATVVAFVGLSQTSLTTRAVGFQGDANMYALYELAAIPIAASLASISTGKHRRRWFMVVVLLIAAVLAAQSRGGLLATFGIMVFLLWTGEFGGRFAVRPRLKAMLGAGLLFAVVALAYLTIPRFHSEDATANRGTGRVDIWHAAWAGWEQHPVLGLGAGNFIKQSDDLLSSTPGVQLDPYSDLFYGIKVHNAYLEPWVELGPIGLGLYVAVLITVGIVLYRVYRNEPTGGAARAVPDAAGVRHRDDLPLGDQQQAAVDAGRPGGGVSLPSRAQVVILHPHVRAGGHVSTMRPERRAESAPAQAVPPAAAPRRPPTSAPRSGGAGG